MHATKLRLARERVKKGRLEPMNRDALESLLFSSLQDGRLSRSERAVLRELLEESKDKPHELDWIRSRAFAAAREHFVDPEGKEALDWLDDVVGVLLRTERPLGTPPPLAEVHFSPGDACRLRIQQLLGEARRQIDICVFTITDDRISAAILDAHRRGINTRIITDNEKSLDRGSDIERLQEAGVKLAFDKTSDHMHHKFALFDQRIVISGSYNWTRSAANHNEENIIVSNDEALVMPFRERFEALWLEMSE